VETIDCFLSAVSLTSWLEVFLLLLEMWETEEGRRFLHNRLSEILGRLSYKNLNPISGADHEFVRKNWQLVNAFHECKCRKFTIYFVVSRVISRLTFRPERVVSSEADIT